MTERTPLDFTLAALAARLDARLAELSHEVAHYPTPIARCDEQLTKLLEQRAACVARLRDVRSIVERDGDDRAHATGRLVAAYGYAEDDAEREIVSRLGALVATALAGHGLRAVTNHVDEGAQTPWSRA